MSVTDLGVVSVPPEAAVWIDRVVLVFIALLIIWIVLKATGYFMRRAYNLTPVATAGGNGISPDFLAVDHVAQKQMIERGRAFDAADTSGFNRAVRLANFGMLASGCVSIASAAFLAFARIEEFDRTWRNLSAPDRFVAIIESHPFGFAIALAMIVAAMVRLTLALRTAK